MTNLIELIAATVSLLMIIPMFLGLMFLMKGFSFRSKLSSKNSKLLGFNTLIYSAAAVLVTFEYKSLLAFVILSFFMFPTYLLILYGKYYRWDQNRVRKPRKFTEVDRIRAKIRRRARVKYEARIRSREKARRLRKERF